MQCVLQWTSSVRTEQRKVLELNIFHSGLSYALDVLALNRLEEFGYITQGERRPIASMLIGSAPQLLDTDRRIMTIPGSPQQWPDFLSSDCGNTLNCAGNMAGSGFVHGYSQRHHHHHNHQTHPQHHPTLLNYGQHQPLLPNHHRQYQPHHQHQHPAHQQQQQQPSHHDCMSNVHVNNRTNLSLLSGSRNGESL